MHSSGRPMPDLRNDLDRLLDAEHSALLSGDYAALSALSSRKAEILETGAVFLDLSETEGLRRKLDRNQTLLAMAISGVRSARGDIEAIQGQKGGFRTYDKHGGSNVVGGTRPGFERKV